MNCGEVKRNYRSLEDYFLKVEKRFLIAAGHVPDYPQDNVTVMVSRNLYLKPKISFRIADTKQNININCSQLRKGVREGIRGGYFLV
jgi:hypothetical protein